MNPVDLAVLAIIALSAVFAFARGFAREVLSIAAWVGAALFTFYAFNGAHAIVARFVTTPLLAELVAGAGLFLVSLIALTVLTGSIAGLVQWSALTPIDRTLGLVFGVVRGAVLVSVAYFVIDITLPPNDRPGWLTQARSQPLLAEGANVLRRVLPDSLQLKSANALDDAQRALGQAKAARDARDALANPGAPAPTSPQEPRYRPTEQDRLNGLANSIATGGGNDSTQKKR